MHFLGVEIPVDKMNYRGVETPHEYKLLAQTDMLIHMEWLSLRLNRPQGITNSTKTFTYVTFESFSLKHGRVLLSLFFILFCKILIPADFMQVSKN